MKINNYQAYDQISEGTIKAAREAKWNQFNRVYILQADNKFTAITLNIFERLKKIFGVDYFQKALKTEEYKLIDCKSFKPIPLPMPAQPAALPLIVQPEPSQPVKPSEIVAQPKASQAVPKSEEEMELLFEQALRSTFRSLGLDPDSPELETAFDQIEPVLEQLLKYDHIPTNSEISATCNQMNLSKNNRAQVEAIYQGIQAFVQALQSMV